MRLRYADRITYLFVFFVGVTTVLAWTDEELKGKPEEIPVPTAKSVENITLRQFYAAHALSGMAERWGGSNQAEAVKVCFDYADLMIQYEKEHPAK